MTSSRISLEICKKLVTDKKAVKGHVIPLTFYYAHLTRGSQSSKTVLYPPEDVVPALAQASTPHAFRDAGLVLRDAILDPRFIILDLDTMILEVQVLQHCSPQIYTIHDWNERICKVDRWQRKFKVMLALEFKHHVLTFGSQDNNTRVFWSATEEYYVKHWSYIPNMLRPSSASFELEGYLSEFNETALSRQPYIFVDPLVYYNGFLATVVWFIVLIRKRKQTMVQKREANHICSKYLSRVCSEDLEASEWHDLNNPNIRAEGTIGLVCGAFQDPSDDDQGSVDEDIIFNMEKSAGQEKYNLDGMSIIKLLREPGPFPTRGIGVYASAEILRRTDKTDTGPAVCEH
ncbi:uncharacterized protein ARMOST_07962 [Armillaria ostoyae]|uniref:Uncharacterized protein n=1 Tax=Armillaria ostoyae TaxID=47428 RepID=A0A284R7C7_ARMOS|nr:uncharacterized protein ARMOST_07962 [Armillaria ostoyae]